MELFSSTTKFDFVGKSRGFIIFSALSILASFGLIFGKGLNFGIEFAGGTEALVSFTGPTSLDDVRAVCDGIGLDQAELVRYGITDEGRYFVRSRTRSLLSPAEVDKVRASIVAKHGEPSMWDASDETGEEIRVRFEGAKTADELKTAALESGITGIEVSAQSGGSRPVFLMRMPSIRSRLTDSLKAKFGDSFKSVERLESVGSAVGEQMRNQGILALIYAILGILLYVTFRFDMRFGPGAILALFHDVVVTVGCFALFGWEFNLQIVAALLAILGYSVNDTVVIYDRIREVIRDTTGVAIADVVNLSINQTLSRTMITSGVTLISVLALLFVGGEITRGFAIAMTIGVIAGSYSTIFIASPLTIYLDKYFGKEEAASTQVSTAVSRP